MAAYTQRYARFAEVLSTKRYRPEARFGCLGVVPEYHAIGDPGTR